MSKQSRHNRFQTELDRLIHDRRSIRKYTSQMVPEECVADLIHSAAWAPSPSNTQPVRFFHLQSDAVRNRLRESMENCRKRLLGRIDDGEAPRRLKNWLNVYWRFSIFMFDAPVLLAVGTLEKIEGFAWRLFEAGFSDQPDQMHTDLAMAVGMATQGLFLKATEMGLGSCILTAPLSFIDDPDAILGVDGFRLLGFITLGYAAESPQPPKRGDISMYYGKL